VATISWLALAKLTILRGDLLSIPVPKLMLITQKILLQMVLDVTEISV